MRPDSPPGHPRRPYSRLSALLQFFVIDEGIATYTLTGGGTELDNLVDCPRRVKVVGNAAAVQLRGSRTKFSLATQLTFVLVGQRARDYTTQPCSGDPLPSVCYTTSLPHRPSGGG